MYILCQGSGTCSWLFEIGADGVVSMARYRDENGYATAGTNAWLPFHATFFTE